MKQRSHVFLYSLLSTLFTITFCTSVYASEAAEDADADKSIDRVTELEQADQEEMDDMLLEEVIITGTRTQGRTAADSPVPIDSTIARRCVAGKPPFCRRSAAQVMTSERASAKASESGVPALDAAVIRWRNST